MSMVTVPVFGFGIRPFGPRTLPRRPTDFIMSGVAINASKSVQFSFWIFSTMSSPPTKSAPAASASRTFSPLAITSTFLVLPSPCGSTTVPRTIWSACLGSTPRRIVRSTVSSNFANFTFWRRGTASCSVYGRLSTAARAFSTFFPDFFMLLLVSHRCRCCQQPWCLRPAALTAAYVPRCGTNLLRDYVNPHRPRRALHALDRRFNRRGIQVGHLLLGDFHHLLLGHLAYLVFVGRARTLSHGSGPLQQDRRRRRLGDERKRAVAVHADHHRDDESIQLLGVGLRVELLAELHDVDLRLTQR